MTIVTNGRASFLSLSLSISIFFLLLLAFMSVFKLNASADSCGRIEKRLGGGGEGANCSNETEHLMDYGISGMLSTKSSVSHMIS